MSYKVFKSIETTDTVYVKLAWSTSFTFNPGLPTGIRLFSLNSPFDPDITGVGNQPIGYDQWSAMYARYQCFGSSIMANTINQDSTVACLTSIYPSITGSPPAFFLNSSSQPYGKSAFCDTLGSGKARSKIKHFMRVKKLEGRQTDSVNYTASTGGNPSNLRYWVMQFQTPNNIDFVNVVVWVKLVYYVKFYNRIDLGFS